MNKKSVGRPKKEPDEVLAPLSLKVSPETIVAVEYIAGQLDRPIGWTARKLLMRGITVYLHDVQVMRPEDAIQEPSERLKNASREPMATETMHKTNPKLIQSSGKKRDKVEKVIEFLFAFTGRPPSDADMQKIREIFEEE